MKCRSHSLLTRSHALWPARRGRVIAGAMVGLGLIAAAFAFGEISHLRSSRRRLGSRGGAAGVNVAGSGAARDVVADVRAPRDHASESGSDQIILVLGYRNRGTKANGLNRFWVRAGLRSIDPAAESAVIIFCGGTVAGPVAEAHVLDDYARNEIGFAGRSLLETESTSTWENIANATALVDEVLLPESSICIVSNSHHAEKARAHLWQMRPDLAARLVRGADYRFGELPLVKPIAAARGLLALREMDRASAVGTDR